MKAQLIWNAHASNTTLEATDFMDALSRVGFEAELCQTPDLEALDQVLEQPEEVVIVGGGDGTLRQVVKRLRGHDVKILLLPLGTANNFAGALGIRRDPFELIAALEEPIEQRLDLGILRFDQYEDVFLEGAGIGLFAHAMLSYGEDHGKSVIRALKALTQTVTASPQVQVDFRAKLEDGTVEHFSSEVSLLEVMNTSSIGPRLTFVPNASLSDGLLDLITIEPSQGVGFLNYAINALSGSLDSLENVKVRRVKEVQLDFSGGALHFDGDSLELPAAHIEFYIEAQAMRFLVPRQAE